MELNMLLDLADYKTKTRSAVKKFWINERTSAKRRTVVGKSGKRAHNATTADNGMQGFIDLIVDIVNANGLTKADILFNDRILPLPGHFYPTQTWDLLVMNQGKLIAAIKFDFLLDASFINDADSGSKEVLGMAMELQATFRQGALGVHRKLFVGYLCLIEEALVSRRPLKEASLIIPLLPEYRYASYAERYNILCKKLMAERLYDAATIIVSSRSSAKSGEYTEMSDITGLKTFVAHLAAHIAAEAVL
jgi:hypothetical protein